ncbi:MAG: TonB-dependent receptor, partial [Nitrospirales bacterium]|nr:TonB-dependent receptor [Nitrospirales bacterium]
KVSSSPNQGFNADLQLTVPIFESQILTTGGGFKQAKASTEEHNLTDWKDEDSQADLTYRSGGEDRTWSLFVQDEIIIRENLSLFLGARQDWWETSDGYANQIGSAGYPKEYDSRSASSFSPKAAVVYKPFDGTTLRASAGKAFRPPTVYELYRTWTGSTGVVYNGNPDLKPETTVSWDLGVEQTLWRGAKAKATYFDNHLKDLIYRMTVSATEQDYINAGKATSRGVTLEMEQRLENWLRLFANYTYTNGKIEENIAKPTTEGMNLTYMPRNMVNAAAEVTKGPITASVTGRYVGKRYGDDENKDIVNGVYTSYDPFFTADAKVSYAVTKFATVSLSVDNIFDKDYFSYYKAPGRSWFGEVTVRF